MGKGLEGGHLGYMTQLIYINFLSNSPRNFHMNCGFKSSFSFWEKIEIWVTFGQGQRMTLAFGTHLTSLTLVDCFD